MPATLRFAGCLPVVASLLPPGTRLMALRPFGPQNCQAAGGQGPGGRGRQARGPAAWTQWSVGRRGTAAASSARSPDAKGGNG
jgi:hypothetical protein